MAWVWEKPLMVDKLCLLGDCEAGPVGWWKKWLWIPRGKPPWSPPGNIQRKNPKFPKNKEDYFSRKCVTRVFMEAFCFLFCLMLGDVFLFWLHFWWFGAALIWFILIYAAHTMIRFQFKAGFEPATCHLGVAGRIHKAVFSVAGQIKWEKRPLCIH